RIRSWWSERHDHALRRCIAEFQWLWQFRSGEYVRSELSDDEILRWAIADPRIRPRGELELRRGLEPLGWRGREPRQPLHMGLRACPWLRSFNSPLASRHLCDVRRAV